MNPEALFQESIELLRQLIATPSFSREEDKTAELLLSFFHKKGITTNRHLNNVWMVNKYFDTARPTILLSSHHDTVKPNTQYKRDPFMPTVEDGKLFGLGSNDAGGSVVSLAATFLHFYEAQSLKYNLVLAITAEEEISGRNGVESVLPLLPPVDFAMVGEPTQMNLALAEKGLLVIDAVSKGKAGHAAREEGENAIYKAVKDINWISVYRFPKKSEWLGEVKMTITVIETENKAHNIIPAECHFVIDVRVPDVYSLEEVNEIIAANLQSSTKARSFRLRSSRIEQDHPIVRAGIALGKSCYGSPATSDKALMNFPALKCGPGDSARSHMADEFIYLDEIKTGMENYIQMLGKVIL